MASRLTYLRCAPGPRIRLALAFALVVVCACAVPHTAAAGSGEVRVMTRNLDLGANLSPATRAGSVQQLANEAGRILNEVDANNFPVRARGLAAEIRSKNPDLVGLQEVALWRTAPCTRNPMPPSAQNVRYDYLALLLKELNRGGNRYRLVVSQPEFDFEIWANTDGDESTSAPGCPFGSEINGRLTMRDVILARTGSRVQTKNARGGHFETQLQVRPAGVPIDVVRGWTRVDAKVRGAGKFRFVNTHLEAFDNQQTNHTNTGREVGNGEIRQAQARELVARGGPATSKRPVILLGDLNSDVATEVKPGDALAYRAVLKGGFVERSTSNPLSCCIDAAILRTSAGGSRSDFDHKVDHIMTDAPRKLGLLRSSVTGLEPVNGYWNSDHAGLFSALRWRPAAVRLTG